MHTDIEERASAASAPRSTKSAQVLKLLTRTAGASLAQLGEATGWQPHTVRAHLTRLRQRGAVLERLPRKSGPPAYHVVRAVPQAAEHPGFVTAPVDAEPASENA